MEKHIQAPLKAYIYDTHYILAAQDGRDYTVQIAVVKRDPVVLPECWEMHKANAARLGRMERLRRHPHEGPDARCGGKAGGRGGGALPTQRRGSL